jgi:hypothetical protein
LPVFEIKTGQPDPKNKEELKELFDDDKAVFFHYNICKRCHQIPDGEIWLQDNNTMNMEVYVSVKRQGKFNHWEPFFISSDKVSQYLLLILKSYYFQKDSRFSRTINVGGEIQ